MTKAGKVACEGITKAGRRCSRHAVEGTSRCRQHAAQASASALTDQQRRFVDEYLLDLNGAAAARRAGYAEGSAHVAAHRLLINDKVRETIERRLDEESMGKAEVLRRLAIHARGSLDPFLVEDARRPGGVRLDISTDEAKQSIGLLKKLKIKTTILDEDAVQETVEVELYDAQAALVHLGKAHGLFVDRQEVTGKDGAPLVPPRVRLAVEGLSDTTLDELERALKGAGDGA
jgi:phage terminase small subunit